MTIFSSWELRSRAVKNRSAELTTLDASVRTLALSGAGAKDVNLLNAYQNLVDWQAAQPGEVTTLGTAATELNTDIIALYQKNKSQLQNVVSTGVKPAGWRYVAFAPLVHTFAKALPLDQRVSPGFTTAETMRVNEAIRRVKLAITYARDAMIKIANGNPSAEQAAAYGDFFGAVDNARIKAIAKNFKVLAIAFDTGPDIVDLRNTDYGRDVYAACYRKSLATTLNGTLSLTGSVNMFMGRAFFGRGNYEKTSDDTIGTLVHEFAHGAVNAVDVPPVDINGVWTHGRVSDDPNHADFGASTDNAIQASTIPLDKLLAAHQPAYAAVNADSHGQFATRLLVNNHG